ncbi:MAG: manganese efflux pump [Lachnospiraceae bacterium]|nr:manganese efflux pump [Lachnospiraceae bacterium]
MQLGVVFFLNSIFLGFALAMDAFSVSVADGLKDANVAKKKSLIIASVFGGFQALFPFVGWICVHSLVVLLKAFEKAVPWIALILLLFLGIKMIIEGVKAKEEDEAVSSLGFKTIILQGVAVSIDALSVGFTIAEYNLLQVVISVSIIGIMTFAISLLGFLIGKKIGSKLTNKAQIVGGVILIAIGLEIFITSFF